jgi:hypothetical protein
MYCAHTHGYGKATTWIGPSLPPVVRLTGRGFRAKISFRASPLFGAGLGPSEVMAGATAGARNLEKSRRDDEAESRRREDDDADDE